jgi:hypothetical protein
MPVSLESSAWSIIEWELGAIILYGEAAGHAGMSSWRLRDTWYGVAFFRPICPSR